MTGASHPVTRSPGGRLLLELGADLRAADPHIDPDRFPRRTTAVECTTEALAAADAVVLLVDHVAFART